MNATAGAGLLSLVAGFGPAAWWLYRGRTVILEELLAVAGTLSVAAVTLVYFLTGAAGRFSAGFVYAVMGATWLAVGVAARRTRQRPARITVGDPVGLALLGLALLLAGLHVGRPLLNWDLLYLFADAGRRYAEEGRIPLIYGPSPLEFPYSTFHYYLCQEAWLYTHRGGDASLQALAVADAGLLGLCAMAMAERAVPRFGGRFAILLLAGTWMMRTVATDANETILVGVALAGALLLLVTLPDDPTPLRALLAGAALGFAGALRFSSWAVLPALLALVRRTARPPGRGLTARGWLALGLGVAMAAAPLLLYNQARVGNPVYPYFFGGRGLDDWFWPQIAKLHTCGGVSTWESWGPESRFAWKVFGPLLLIVPLWLLVRPFGRRSPQATLLTLGLGAWLLALVFFGLCASNYRSRYLVHVMAFAPFCLLDLLQRLRADWRGVGRWAAVAGALVVGHASFEDPATREISWQERILPVERAFRNRLNALPSGSRVALFWHKTYRLRVPWLPADGRVLRPLYAHRDPPGVLARGLRARGITHLAIWQATLVGYPIWGDPEGPVVRLLETPSLTRLVWQVGEARVYELIRPRDRPSSGRPHRGRDQTPG